MDDNQQIKVLYQNERFKVCYLDYGFPYGKLYGIFRINEESTSNNQIARKTLKQAIKEADYLNRLNEWGDKYENKKESKI